ncbi:tetratricopeptide repeat protein [Sorangium sp. So ce1024]|uniref:tetratricopeptide repeat protein n=1 Tax=unclassified Sorangium TaxID=2621164 RepID=UPI003F0A538D
MRARPPARSRRIGALLAAALLAAALPSSASAQGPGDVESARVLFVQGAKLAREGRWEEARALYARSLEIKPAPLTRYSLGVAQKELGHLADALASFRAFLAEPSTPATAPYVGPAREAVAVLEGRVGRATIAVRPGDVDGLTLVVDGKPVRGSRGQAIALDPGAHEVVASAPGFRSTAARFTVAAGGSVEVPLALAPVATAAARASGAGGGLPPVADPSGAPSRGALPIVVMGVGGAFLTGGAVLGLSGLKQASAARTSAGADASAARAKGIVGDVLGGVGLATVGVGLYLLLDDPAPSATETGSVGPWLGASGSGIEVRF